MKFSTSTAAAAVAATLMTSVAASPAPAAVTEYVHVTQEVYLNAHVFVDQNGTPVTTSYETVSTFLPVVDASSSAVASSEATSDPAPSSTSTVDPTTLVVAAAVTQETSAAPVTTSAPVSSAAAVTTTSVSTSGDFSGDGTFYSPGLGACGLTNSDTDFIAALNAPQFGSYPNPNNNPNCGKKALVHYNGKSVEVTITDKCPTCAFGSLDLSPIAFNELADPAQGRIPITWEWVN
jgi:hypothetical protein